MARPYQITDTRAVFTPDNLVRLKAVTDNFYMELDQEFPGFHRHTLVSQFTFDEVWSTWEVHPMGDELVMLLSGDTDLVLWVDGEEEIVRINAPGEYVVVPKNTWHTARPYAPTSMLFITPGEGTLNATEPGGEQV